MRILIIRHAEPDYAHDSLTDKGKREAELLSRRLARIPASAYYSSPLGRAKETASYTLNQVGKEAEVLPWLAEFRGRVDNAEAGRKHLAWDFRSETWHSHPLLLDRERWTEDPLMSGGNVSQIWQETRDGVDALLARHGYQHDGAVWRCEHNTDETIMLFCHFGIGTAVLAHLINVSPFPLWHGTLWLPSSVTTVVTQERQPSMIEFRCVGLGDVNHLLDAGEAPSLAGLFPEQWNGVESTAPDQWPSVPALPVIR